MATCAGFIQPLNLQCLFINIFAGSSLIFMFLAMMVIGALGARFQMRDEVVLLMLGLFAFIFAQYENGFVILFLLIAGIIIYSMMKRPITRT